MKNFILFIACTFLTFNLFGQSENLLQSVTLTEEDKPTSLASMFQTKEPGNLSKTQSEPWENGFFIDGIFGFGGKATVVPGSIGNPGSTVGSHTVASAAVRFGSKWYFGQGSRFRPGFQVIWARIGAVAPLPFSSPDPRDGGYASYAPTLTFAPLNIGATHLFIFSDNVALEANLNLGLNANVSLAATGNNNQNQTLLQFGFLLNPVLKLRYRKFAIGIDFVFTHSLPGQIYESNQSARSFSYNTNMILVGITVGAKF